nr:MAG TPA: caprin-2 domain protein [Caudoviricetes sp.]
MTDKARCGGSITPVRSLISKLENSDYFCQDPAPTIL